MKLRTQIFAGYGLVFILMIILATVMYRSIITLVATSDWVAHTHAVIAQARKIEKLMVDKETGERGFLIAGEDEFLEPYENGRQEYEKTVVALRALISDNPAQLERLDGIELLVKKWHRVAASVEIEERRKVGRGDIDADYLQQLVGAGVGKDILDAALARTARLDAALARAEAPDARYLVLAISKDMVDMETGQRGFLVTGSEPFLEPYLAGRVSLDEHLAALREVAPAAEHAEIDALEDLARSWVEKAGEPEIAARRAMNQNESSLKAVAAMIRQGTGKSVMDALRVELGAFVEAEEELLIDRDRESEAAAIGSLAFVIVGTVVGIALGLLGMLYVTRTILRQVGGEPALIAGITEQVARGDLEIDFPGSARTSTGILAAVRTMVDHLRINKEQMHSRDWLKTGIARINDTIRGEQDIVTLSGKLISEMTTYVDAQMGAIYRLTERAGEEPALSLAGSFAYTKRKNLSNQFELGEGLVGQAALERQQILLRNVPEDYVKVTSGLGQSTPMFISVSPFLFEDRVKGVIEIGSMHPITDTHLEYLSQAMLVIGISVQAMEGKEALSASLHESQRLTEELQAQQEELRASNEELEEQAQQLQESKEKLQAQQEELESSNEELERTATMLGRQKGDVERASAQLQRKAEELARASKYKSEFLANMSHELRTPLNSLLLLASSLRENKERNLSDDQVEAADVIHGSGSALLSLINEILDLSKIEAGQMVLHPTRIRTSDLVTGLRRTFEHMARDKGLKLEVAVDDDAPLEITTDRKRLEQVVRNLVSNALKFTETGGVTVTFGRPGGEGGLSSCSIEVRDTGIGISGADQEVIFEAFQQADGSTSRRFGGTGLGLSIARELTGLLGGEIQLHSELGAGSTFTLVLPVDGSSLMAESSPSSRAATSARAPASGPDSRVPEDRGVARIPDDRDALETDDRVLLVIEDDPTFARQLYKRASQRGFKCVISPTGEEGLELARANMPTGVLLDLELPGMSGEAVLVALKDDPVTRHIPVHIISVTPPSTETLGQGAVGHLTKPVDTEGLEAAFHKIEDITSRKVKNLLVVEDDAPTRESIVALVASTDVKVSEATTGEQALQALRANRYDCVILDLGLKDMGGDELLRELGRDQSVGVPPVIVYTAWEVSREQETELREHAESIILKDVRSQERLFDEVSLFLHKVVSDMPKNKRQIITDLHDTDALLRDKDILIVDDDMRTVFALSRFLAERGVKPLKAADGKKALEILEAVPGVDMVLMDIMMPVMDGYETMKRIRSDPAFGSLPILALTAKAMKSDRQRCLAAGANDYLPKPVDQEQLLSMMRVWLYR